MGVKKFRDVRDGRGRARAGSQSDLSCSLRFPSGVFKHRSIENTEALREQWEEANFREHQLRKRGS